jgi:hypothetical protein
MLAVVGYSVKRGLTKEAESYIMRVVVVRRAVLGRVLPDLQWQEAGD